MNVTRKGRHIDAYPIDKPIIDKTWKMFQIISEFVEGYERLAHIGKAVSVFGSARTDEKHPSYQKALAISKELSDEGFAIITGGGPGIMEAGNRGASLGTSLSVGLNIDLPFEEAANTSQDISLRYRFFFTRKAMFIKHSNAFICFPGGFGTMDELFTVLTLIQTKKKSPVPIFLVNKSYWKGLIDWMCDSMVGNQTISPEDMDLFHHVETAEEIIEGIRQHRIEIARNAEEERPEQVTEGEDGGGFQF